ncbi:MAG: hypothetical protein CM1200mP30_28250 [Pseudomonadota bacterium]|nr:MAG: hypothetical protein CM1200mP30_28250 [Pseudomonadota bacterium]
MGSHIHLKPKYLEALSGVLCRCTGYTKIVKAVINSGQKQTSNLLRMQEMLFGSRMVKVDGQKKNYRRRTFWSRQSPPGLPLAPDNTVFHLPGGFSLINTEKVFKKYSGLVKVLQQMMSPVIMVLEYIPNQRSTCISKRSCAFQG